MAAVRDKGLGSDHFVCHHLIDVVNRCKENFSLYKALTKRNNTNKEAIDSACTQPKVRGAATLILATKLNWFSQHQSPGTVRKKLSGYVKEVNKATAEDGKG